MTKGKHEMFLNKIKPYPFHKDGCKEVYIKVVDIEDIDDIEKLNDKYERKKDYNIQITLINEDMINYDSEFFMGDNMEEYYRPYFYEFYVNDINERTLKFLYKNKGKWLKGNIEQYHFYKNRNDAFYVVKGKVFFSASPFQTKSTYLIIKDKGMPEELYNRYISTYDVSSAIVLPGEDRFDKMCKYLSDNVNSNNFNIKIYNVGQGNCVYIYSKKNKRILFDIGFNKNPNSSDWYDKNIKRSKKAIMRMKPHLNILSHWDMDHIIGVTFASKEMFNHPWIAPNILELRSVSASAARLAKYLCWKKQLYLIGEKYLGNSVFISKGFNIWRGKGRDNSGLPNYGLNKANNFGLIIELTGINSMILPGDCEYKMFPDFLLNNIDRYNYLMVPHHCSKMELVDMNFFSNSKRSAIISAGHNTYSPRHPYLYHKVHLICSNYDVFETKNNFYIHIKSINGNVQIYERN
ncbi:hypothetical protein [Clostridium perfringens]|uniref:hypothetical protein n=1 Tax=Clostridium perfringens TaxID=1502 RepID=UPI0039E8B853